MTVSVVFQCHITALRVAVFVSRDEAAFRVAESRVPPLFLRVVPLVAARCVAGVAGYLLLFQVAVQSPSTRVLLHFSLSKVVVAVASSCQKCLQQKKQRQQCHDFWQ